MLNYACRTIIFKALIFNQILSVVNFMLKGRWSTNERSFISFGTFGELLILSELHKQTTKRNIDYYFWTHTSFSLCLLTDDTKIALHLRDNQGRSLSSTAVVSKTVVVVAMCLYSLLYLWLCVFICLPPVSVFTTKVLVPDCFLIFLEDVWLNQLINFVQL